MCPARPAVLKIGLTGGIASGKSVVADLFAALNVPVIDTDVIAREVVAPGEPGLTAVVKRFGSEVLDDRGTLDRKTLRRLIFTDPKNREDLEGILHPLIRSRTLDQSRLAGGPYQVIVVPLLLESGFDTHVDRILVIDCSEASQRTRLLARDDETPEQIEQILAAQADRRQRLAAADDVIDNSGSLEETRRQVTALHEQYLALAGSHTAEDR